MEEQLIKFLKQLKLIEPSEEFIKRSRPTILSAPQLNRSIFSFKSNIFEGFRLAAALTLGSALLFVFLGGVSYLNMNNGTPGLLTDANEESLRAEEEKSDFQIELSQVNYDLDAEKGIGARIDEFLKNLSL